MRGVTPLELGHSSRQWLFDTDEGALMLKVPARDPNPHKLRNLMAATRVAAELDVPVSRYRAFLPDDEAVHGPVLVQEFVPGEQAAAVWSDLDSADRVRVAQTLGRWIGLLHTHRGTDLTDLLGADRYPSIEDFVIVQLDEAVAAIGEVDVDIPLARRRVEQGLAEFGEVEPALCHRDVYLDNVLLRQGRPSRLLDFEHARFLDRYAEFGKIRELLFDWFPETEQPFLEAYQDLHPIDELGRHHIHVHIGLYNLVMCGYFTKWAPDLVPTYLDRIRTWLAS
ncbi:hypothetical protein BU204_05725 [Actinophytocola xanthii]|uniref:Aminoglycoside phosphotransferase domain-containing protein n=1 Tax=Actinophytocola xanthii TaxID=1912961 RepID=A0A1Q8CVT6_9PSEU|nr:hypothetical protein BU204_05725 [Actinophytocola xanthii]